MFDEEQERREKRRETLWNVILGAVSIVAILAIAAVILIIQGVI